MRPAGSPRRFLPLAWTIVRRRPACPVRAVPPPAHPSLPAPPPLESCQRPFRRRPPPGRRAPWSPPGECTSPSPRCLALLLFLSAPTNHHTGCGHCSTTAWLSGPVPSLRKPEPWFPHLKGGMQTLTLRVSGEPHACKELQCRLRRGSGNGIPKAWWLPPHPPPPLPPGLAEQLKGSDCCIFISPKSSHHHL